MGVGGQHAQRFIIRPLPGIPGEIGDRITSYNVCYTKLLRFFSRTDFFNYYGAILQQGKAAQLPPSVRFADVAPLFESPLASLVFGYLSASIQQRMLACWSAREFELSMSLYAWNELHGSASSALRMLAVPGPFATAGAAGVFYNLEELFTQIVHAGKDHLGPILV